MFGRENHKEEWTGFLDCDKFIYDAIKSNKKLEANIKELEAELRKHKVEHQNLWVNLLATFS